MFLWSTPISNLSSPAHIHSTEMKMQLWPNRSQSPGAQSLAQHEASSTSSQVSEAHSVASSVYSQGAEILLQKILQLLQMHAGALTPPLVSARRPPLHSTASGWVQGHSQLCTIDFKPKEATIVYYVNSPMLDVYWFPPDSLQTITLGTKTCHACY